MIWTCERLLTDHATSYHDPRGTMRGERVVRADPGTASDRQGAAVGGQIATRQRPNSGTLDELREPGNQPLAGDLPRTPRRSTREQQNGPKAELALRLSSPLQYPVAEVDSSQVKSRKGPHPSIRNPFLLLHELGRHHGAFEILLLLDQERVASPSSMRQSLRSGQEALESSLEDLTRIGLVRMDRASDFPFTKTYRLTVLGRSLIETPVTSWFRVLVE